MGYWLDRAEQHLDDWEIPVKSTSYPQEARDFWSEQRDARKNRDSSLATTRGKAVELLTQTDQRLDDYGDRLSDEEKEAINAQQTQLKADLDNPKLQEDTSKIEESVTQLNEKMTPLKKAIADANTILLHSAHDAIFAGEKDLLDGGYDGSAPTNDPDLQAISNAVKNLKNLVMSPQEFWNKQDITAATSAVSEARAKVLEKVAVVGNRAKALEEARKMVEADAGLAAAAALSPASSVSNTSMTVSSSVTSAGALVQNDPGPGMGPEAAVSIVVQTVIGPVVTVTPEAVVWTTTTALAVPTGGN